MYFGSGKGWKDIEKKLDVREANRGYKGGGLSVTGI